MSQGTIRVVGADACVGGWVAVALEHGRVAKVWSGPSLPALLVDESTTTVVGLDLPLGGVPTGWRTADREAKLRLGIQHSKVFLVPPRSVWELPHAQASARCVELTGKGLSIQAYRLLPKMLEAEQHRDAGPHELYEIHPELVFASLAGRLLPYGKKSWNGQMLRRALLAGVGVALDDDLPLAFDVPANDVLDAAAVAWCAHKIARGNATHLPDPIDQRDHRGRPIVIWT